MPQAITRRVLIRGSASAALSLAGTALLAACGGSAGVAAPSTGSQATSRAATGTAGIATATKVATTSTATVSSAATASAAKASTTTTARASQAAAGKATNVEFYAYVSNAVESDEWAGYAKTFDDTHPDIHVSVISTTSDRITKLEALLAGGTPPDITQLNNTDFTPFAPRDVLMDLSSFIARDKYDLSDFFPVTYEAFTWKGKKLGLSTDLYVVGFYYVPDLFAAAGLKVPDASWTWNDVKESGIKLTKPDKSQFGMRVYNDYARWSAVVWDFGGQMFDTDQDPRKATFTDQPVIDGISEWVDFVNKDHSSPTSAENSKNKQLLFWFGTMAMDLVDGPTILQLVKKSKADLKWAVAPYPKGPGANGKNVSIAFPDGLEMAKQSKHPDAAWQVLQYFVGPQFLTKFAQDTGRLPSRKSLASSDTYQKPFKDAGVQHTDQLLAQASNANALPITPAGADIRSLANKEMQLSWDGKRSVKDSLIVIQPQAQAMLDKLPK